MNTLGTTRFFFKDCVHIDESIYTSNLRNLDDINKAISWCRWKGKLSPGADDFESNADDNKDNNEPKHLLPLIAVETTTEGSIVCPSLAEVSLMTYSSDKSAPACLHLHCLIQSSYQTI